MRERRCGFSTRNKSCDRKEEEREENGKRKRETGRKEMGKEKVGVTAMFWNVAGTGNLREDDWKYIRTHEIIALTETWEEVGKEICRKKLIGYEIKEKLARREKKKRRAKGGILLAIKKDCGLEVEWEEEETNEAIWARWERDGEKWTWGINYMRQTKKEN